MSLFEIRTDLALESGERFKQSNVEVRGVCIESGISARRWCGSSRRMGQKP